jgi:hypothetical protein
MAIFYRSRWKHIFALFHAPVSWVCLDMDMKDQTGQINFRGGSFGNHFGQLIKTALVAKDI